MRTSQLLISTQKETPSDAEIISHQLMLRAGLIRKLSAGLYSWLPLGLKVLRKVERIVREEMDAAGALEISMPMVQPAELWQESGRWEQYGAELLRLQDRHERPFCLGPTHEEVITDIARNEIRSYKQLPLNFYQIQTKFRDEIRPRFGIMRAREFLMKDAYSFHLDAPSLQETYDRMYEAYSRIFTRLGLHFRAVEADTGSIGGNASHEFHVLADSGEDAIAFSDTSDYAANVELAAALPPAVSAKPATQPLMRLATPNVHSIEALSEFAGVPASQCVKTLIVMGAETGSLVALVLRGDHQLNSVKAEKLPEVAKPLTMADEASVRKAVGAGFGSLGPIGLPFPVIADHAAAACHDFLCGANEDGAHWKHANWTRDCSTAQAADLRNVVAGDPSPDGQGTLLIKRGIEVGHIFQLGEKYSAAMGAQVLDEHGTSLTLSMGCYGIGVSRIVASAIEQNHDQHGIIWPEAIAPFTVAIIPINAQKSPDVAAAAEALYTTLCEAGVDTLIDDRAERPGVKFADTDLLGIPHRIVIGDRALAEGHVEYKARTASDAELLPVASAASAVLSRLQR